MVLSGGFAGGMASAGIPPVSIWQGVRIVLPDNNVTVEGGLQLWPNSSAQESH